MRVLLSIICLYFLSIHLKAQNRGEETISLVPDQVKNGNFISAYTINNSLRLNVEFKKKSYDVIKGFLFEKLGDSDTKKGEKNHVWTKEGEGFKCILTKKDLKLNLNYSLANESMANKVDEIVSDIKYVISDITPEEALLDAQIWLKESEDELKNTQADLKERDLVTHVAKKELIKRKKYGLNLDDPLGFKPLKILGIRDSSDLDKKYGIFSLNLTSTIEKAEKYWLDYLLANQRHWESEIILANEAVEKAEKDVIKKTKNY